MDYEQVSIALAKGEQKEEWCPLVPQNSTGFLKIATNVRYADYLNPMEQVPALLLPDGRR